MAIDMRLKAIQDQGGSLLLTSLPGLIVVMVFVITIPLNPNLTSEMRSVLSELSVIFSSPISPAILILTETLLVVATSTLHW